MSAKRIALPVVRWPLLAVQFLACICALVGIFLAGEFGVQLMILIVLTVQTVAALWLIRIYNGLPKKFIPLASLFIIFYSLFYTVRGWAYLVVGDDELMKLLGVFQTEKYITQALAMCSIFLAFLMFGYIPNALSRYLTKGFQVVFRYLYIGKSNFNLTGIMLAAFIILVGGLAAASAIMLFAFVGGGEGASSAGGFETYVVSIPFIFYGAVAVAWGALLRNRTLRGPVRWVTLVIFVILIALTTWFARGASNYRVSYLTPFAFMAFALIPGRIRIVQFVACLLVVLPFLTFIGNLRYEKEGQLIKGLSERISNEFDNGFWDTALAPFKAGGGDFTCLDIFASALSSEQRFHPWGLSFAYPIVHVIPRAYWKDKPEQGMLTDRESFLTTTDGLLIPYYAGIVGEWYLEGSWFFVPLGGLLVGIFLQTIDAGVFSAYRAGLMDRFVATYGVMAFLMFFLIRTTPYQFVYFAGFTTIGLFVAGKFVRFKNKRVSQTASNARPTKRSSAQSANRSLNAARINRRNTMKHNHGQ